VIVPARYVTEVAESLRTSTVHSSGLVTTAASATVGWPSPASRSGSGSAAARLVRPDVLAGGAIDHPALHAGQRWTDLRRVVVAGVGREVRRSAELGHAIALLDAAAQLIGTGSRQLGTQRCSRR
jgi:hypothetical protein